MSLSVRRLERVAVVPRSLFARALLAYSIYEHQQGHARRIDVWLRPESFTVQDDGRGMGLDREGYVEGLMGLLVGRPAVVQLHGVGLSLVAASTPRLEVESRRGGSLWKQSFAWGVADGPPLWESAGPETGTRISFFGLAGSSDVELAELSAHIERWRQWNPALTIVVH
jgi:DNA gyrase/topoisomerase IV subunit B